MTLVGILGAVCALTGTAWLIWGARLTESAWERRVDLAWSAGMVCIGCWFVVLALV